MTSGIGFWLPTRSAGVWAAPALSKEYGGLPKHAPYYLLHLEDSPSPYIKDTYVYEEDIEKA